MTLRIIRGYKSPSALVDDHQVITEGTYTHCNNVKQQLEQSAK